MLASVPRYLLETGTTAIDERASAISLAASRFPEVAVEHRYVAHDDDGSRELWLCRAPSPAHLQRWADAAHLVLDALQQLSG